MLKMNNLSRAFSTAVAASDKGIVASVLFERLPVVVPKIDPVVYAFQEFSYRWGQQYRRKYPDEVLGKADTRGQGDYHIDYVPAPRITEADKKNDKKSLQRALDRRLYLLLYGTTYGAPGGKSVWHFPEKLYETEGTLRKCAESALKSTLGDLSHTYFVGNAPFAHMVIQPTEEMPDIPSFKARGKEAIVSGFYHEGYEDPLLMLIRRRGVYSGSVVKEGALSMTTRSRSENASKGLPVNYCSGFRSLNCPSVSEGDGVSREIFTTVVNAADYGFVPTDTPRTDRSRFFFKSQVIATNKFKIGKCEDHVWVTKDELMEYFPERADFLNKMIIS